MPPPLRGEVRFPALQGIPDQVFRSTRGSSGMESFQASRSHLILQPISNWSSSDCCGHYKGFHIMCMYAGWYLGSIDDWWSTAGAVEREQSKHCEGTM